MLTVSNNKGFFASKCRKALEKKTLQTITMVEIRVQVIKKLTEVTGVCATIFKGELR
jgi:hypothetical protein